MDFKTYVQSVVAAYVEKQNQNVIFIKHYNTLDITQDEILAGLKKSDDKVFLYHEYIMHQMHQAFSPFLEWIKWCYENFYQDTMSVEEFLKACHVYPLHVEPLAGYIRDGICRRKEDVMNFEVVFESNRMIQDIVGILEYISQHHHLIMIISKFHLAPYAAIQLLGQIIEKTINVHLIIMYNDEFQISAYKKRVWEDLLKNCEDRNLQLDWGSMDSKRTIDVQDEFWFDKNKKEDYLQKLSNMYHTFALQDAYYYMTDIVYRMDEKTIWLTRQEQLPFLQLAAVINMNLGHVNNALVICDKMTSMCTIGTDNKLIKYQYYYTCARARMIQSQLSVVKSLCEKCINIAKELEDDFLLCKAEVLLWTSNCGFNKDIFEYNFLNEVDMAVIEKAKKYGFTNFLAYLYVFGFENDQKSIDGIANDEIEPVYFNKGIELGTKLENDNFLMNAYMKNIILYSRYGYYGFVRKMYKKRLAVLKRPNPMREAHMYAGLGYNSIILEDYERAYEYLCNSVNMLTELESADDIMNSLYNMVLNYFVAESYENAIRVIDIILRMLKELGYQSIRACSNVKLYAMMAISCYYQKEYYNSYYYLSKIEVIVEQMLRVMREGSGATWDEDLLLYHLVKGMLYSYEDSLEGAQQEFDLVRDLMKTASGSRFFVDPIYCIERAELYKKQHMQAEMEQVIKEGMEFCEKEGTGKKWSKLQYYQEHGERLSEPLLTGCEVDLPVSHMLQCAKQTGTQDKLVKRENDIKFLTVLQEAIGRENLTVNGLFQNTSAVLKNSYNLDDIMILRKKDGKISVMHEGDVFIDNVDKINEVFKFFTEYKQAFLTNRTDKNFVQFLPVMQLFDQERIMTMIGIPIVEQTGTETIFLAYVRIKRRSLAERSLLNSDDLMILKFAFSQFCEMMRRIDSRLMIERMTHKLEQSAITDHLTGITNRNGFSKQVEILCSQDSQHENVILYLDLDNFKYYNDTFGHDIGDLVLVCFAEMFKRMTKEKGLPVRYGGDEFIILLYDQNERGAALFAEEIYREISDGFKSEISQKLQRKIDIPD